jgi:hypothetical protein
LQLAQMLLQSLGKDLLVEAGGWGLVGHGRPRSWAAADRQGWKRAVPMVCGSA